MITAPPPHNPILPLVCILQITPLLPPLTLTTKASKQNTLSGHVPLALCLYFLTIPRKYPPAMFSSSPSLSSWESSPPPPPSPPGPRKHSTGVQLRCLKRFPNQGKAAEKDYSGPSPIRLLEIHIRCIFQFQELTICHNVKNAICTLWHRTLTNMDQTV